MARTQDKDAEIRLVAGAEIYAPESMGRMDVLIGGGRILELAKGPLNLGGLDYELIDGSDLLLIPGLVDGHVHILGGGGEGGCSTRTPEIVLSDLTEAGITTAVGCLGTDGTTRTMTSLIAKARGLEAEGVSVFLYTGSYSVPVTTLTGSIRSDLILIDRIVGVGEVAVSDHRSSQPTFEEFCRIVAEARVGGMLGGKAGVVNIHVGDGPRMLELLNRIVRETEIPGRHLLPTHINRSRRLLDAGIDWAKSGPECRIDLTTSGSSDPDLACGSALSRVLHSGVDPRSVSCSSDAQGSLPVFDDQGVVRGLGVGKAASLLDEIRRAVFQYQVPMEAALQTVTSNPSGFLGLRGKGRIRIGADADLVLTDPGLRVHTVLSKGKVMVREGIIETAGTFEQDSIQRQSSKVYRT